MVQQLHFNLKKELKANPNACTRKCNSPRSASGYPCLPGTVCLDRGCAPRGPRPSVIFLEMKPQESPQSY